MKRASCPCEPELLGGAWGRRGGGQVSGDMHLDHWTALREVGQMGGRVESFSSVRGDGEESPPG